MNEKNKEKIKGLLELCLYFFLAVMAVYFILFFVAQRTSVHGSSMNPTLKDRDQLLVEKVSYRFGMPKRFDIIVFNYYEKKDQEPVHYIKRIIGLPGETVFIEDGCVYIDGELLEDQYGYYIDNRTMEGYDAENAITIGENEYFVLGDNRNDSLDSRKIGCIQKSDIIGKAVFCIAPFGSFGVIH